MQTIQDDVETIHLYVVREEEKKPYALLPLLCAFLSILAIATITLYSAEHPYYEHQRLTMPAQLLPLQTFKASAPVIPTGVQFYPATYAHGVLTFTNGSVIGQNVPEGFTIDGVVTDQAVYVPAGNADGFGIATVSAHALISGKSGNVAALAINQVIGSSLYIRNLTAFSGGKDSYSVKFATAQDRALALRKSRNLLTAMVTGLHYPCREQVSAAVIVTWRCQFVQLPRIYIPNARITGIHLLGRNLVVDVLFIAQPQRYWAK